MSSNNVRHPVTKTFTTLHYTSPNYTSLPSHLAEPHLKFPTAPSHLTSLYVISLTRHYTSPYFSLSFYIFYISNYCTEYGKYQNLHILFQITNIMQNSFILQQYVRYTTIFNMFRAARCSSSGRQIVLLQPLVSSVSVNCRTVCRLRADCSCK